MKKTNFIVVAVTLIMTLLLPWLTLIIVRDFDGFGVIVLMIAGIYPMYAAAMGVFAGMKVRSRWCIPLLTSALVWLGMFIFFGGGERAFILYSGAYLVVGLVFMTVSALIKKYMLIK